ncbi:hypothetical protein HDG33_002309 [Paraburkholderia sp. Cpub6]|nr:hypothetical protein [Paraburkholderia sp. Cpub6]
MKPVASPPRPNCTRSTTPAIIAPLDPGNAVAQFRAGYTLRMASRHADAIAADRQPRFGEWEPALETIVRDLRARVAQHRRASAVSDRPRGKSDHHGRSCSLASCVACAISAARHSGHRHRPPGFNRSTGSGGSARHQQLDGSVCMPQSKALPQRGQRALRSERGGDDFIADRRSGPGTLIKP